MEGFVFVMAIFLFLVVHFVLSQNTLLIYITYHYIRLLFLLQPFNNFIFSWRTINIFINYYHCFLFQFSSVAQSCPTLCNPMNRSTPGLPVLHQLPEFTDTHVHWVGDAIQPSHPLSSPSPPALNLSQHQGLFKWVSSSHQVAKVLEFQLQYQSFQWTQDWSPLGWTGWISLQSKGLSRGFSNTTIQKHRFFVPYSYACLN